jgi:hypothetical protein
MKFTYISEQRVLKILRALREVSEDLSRCRLPRSVILRKVLQRNVPSTVLTLARSNDLQDLVEVINYGNASGRRDVEWWYLRPFGAEFLVDQTAKPPERFEQKYEEPDEVKARSLREGKKARRREQRELRRARRLRLGTQPHASEYAEVVENAHDYTWGEINRLPLAKRIAVLRSRCGLNQEAKRNQERIEDYWTKRREEQLR